MRTSRIRTAALAAATAALALGGLTACGSSDGNTATGSAKTSASNDAGKSTGSDEKATGKGAAEQAAGEGTSQASGNKGSMGGAKNGTETAAKSGSGAAKSGSTAVRQCDGQEMSYSVLHRFPGDRGEHLLITAQNADSKPCWITSYPSVMLGDTSNVLPHSGKDAPGGTTKITVKPGGKVYSAVALFADGAKKHTSSELSLALRDQTGDTGPGVEQEAFDAKGVPSKFTWSSADVTNWNTSKPYDF